VHQARLGIGTDMRLHTEVVLIALLGLVHLWISLAILIFGRTRRMNQRRIDDSALTQ